MNKASIPFLIAALVVPAGAVAAARDRDRDRLPDSWERAHNISTKHKSGSRDHDRDRVNNRWEYRLGLNPRSRDSDGDGRRDGSEHGGRVASVDGSTLVIELPSGRRLTGTVGPSTEIECGSRAEHERGDDSDRRRNRGSGSASASRDGADDSPDAPDDSDGRDRSGDDDGPEDNDPACVAALKAGALVHEAELLSSGIFREIELIA